MTRNTSEFLSLESSFSSKIEEIIGEVTYTDSAIELMDVSSGLVDCATHMSMNEAVGLALMSLHGVTENDADARRTAYRAYVFAYASTQMVAAYNYELNITDYIQTALRTDDYRAAVVNDAKRYLAERPMISGYIDAFADELDTSESGRWRGLVRSISGGIFKLAETSMFDTYLDQRVTELE
jgi:hypothetical protein